MRIYMIDYHKEKSYDIMINHHWLVVYLVTTKQYISLTIIKPPLTNHY